MRDLVGLLRQCHPLDLELADAPLDDVDLGGQRVDLDAQARGGLVDEVDRLVGQEPPGQVAVGQDGGGHEGGVLDAHAVVDLVALLQAAEDGDGVVDRGRPDVHLLEAPLEGGVLLDVLAVLVERGGADHAELAPGEQRLEHVAGVHRALGRPGPDDRVQLVDERDDLALGVGDLLEDRLQPLLELAAVLGSRDHRAEVERDDPLVLEGLGDVTLDDAGGQPLDDGGLADARLTDEDRVVLGASRQHLDDPTDLLVAADDRIELALAGDLGEIAAVALERLELILGVLGRDTVATADGLHGGEHVVAGDPQPVGQGEQQVLGRQVLVGEVGAGLVRGVEHLVELAGQPGLAAVGARQLGQRLVDLVAQGQRLLAHALQHREDDALALAQQGGQQVIGGDLGVRRLLGRVDRRAEGLLDLERPTVRIERHDGRIPPAQKS